MLRTKSVVLKRAFALWLDFVVDARSSVRGHVGSESGDWSVGADCDVGLDAGTHAQISGHTQAHQRSAAPIACDAGTDVGDHARRSEEQQESSTSGGSRTMSRGLVRAGFAVGRLYALQEGDSEIDYGREEKLAVYLQGGNDGDPGVDPRGAEACELGADSVGYAEGEDEIAAVMQDLELSLKVR